MEPNPYHPDSNAESRGSVPQPSPQRQAGELPPLVVALAVGSVMVTLGALACAWMVDFFGEMGSISLWGLGAAAGYATCRLSKNTDPKAAIILCVACVLAFVIAETMWVHWNIEGADTFGKALGMLPKFLDQFRQAALIGGVATLFGCMSVWGYVAK